MNLPVLIFNKYLSVGFNRWIVCILGVSRGPSPVSLGNQDTLPVAVALTESVNAYFKGADPTKLVLKRCVCRGWWGLGGKFSEFYLFLYLLGFSVFYLLLAIKQSFRDCLSNLKVTIISNTDGFFPPVYLHSCSSFMSNMTSVA